mgnify:FL=1
MERLTHERVNGIKTGYWSAATKEVLAQKLAAYENTGYEPDEIRAAIEQAAKNSETKTATIMAECIAGAMKDTLEKVGTTIMVQVKSNDTVEVMTTYLSDFSRNTLYRAKADAPGLYTGFRGREVALIELRSLCIPNEGTAYLLDLLSRMTNENSVSTNDNGVTQTVEARQGVALNAVVEIKPRVMLRPFRTFLEVEQPESEFLLRVEPDEGIGFFEADGGIWKLEAKKNIADYFLKNMGDLIDAGKVVVMQ